MDEDSVERPHALIADENEQRLDQIAGVVSDLGHSVVSRLTEVFQVAAATERDRPDVAVVGLGHEHAHALDLISEIVWQAACPVIVDVDGGDPEFVENAAKRGIFASFKHDGPDQMPGASTSRCAATPSSAAPRARSAGAPGSSKPKES